MFEARIIEGKSAKSAVSTVLDLNKKLKEQGACMFFAETKMFPIERAYGGDGGAGAMHNIIAQTGIKTELFELTTPQDAAKEHSVTLTDNEWAYIIDACKIYHDMICNINQEEIKERIYDVVNTLSQNAIQPKEEETNDDC